MRLFQAPGRSPLRAEIVNPVLSRRSLLTAGCACCATALAACAEVPAQPAAATPAAPPPAATRKLSDTTYAFRYQGYQSLFVVTPAGVIATDPNGSNRPQAVAAYIEEIRKITDKPIKYVVYSHHHFDHAAGGKPFKDQGATFIAHRNATAHLKHLANPDVVLPDVSVGDRHDIVLGGVKVELRYVGRNHSDSSLVIGVPKDKLIFAVDFIPIESIPFRGMPDSYLPDWFESLDRVLAMNWEQMLPGHPYAGGRLGTKADVQAVRTYFADLLEATKASKACWDGAVRDVKLPKYEKWANYNTFFPMNVERVCNLLNGA